MHALNPRNAGRSLFWIVPTLGLLWGGVACGPSYPNCDTDEDCHQGEYCVDGLCQQCRSDADCPAGQQCAEGACTPIEGYCESAADCGEGEECQNNRCVASATTDLGQTPAPTEQGCQIEPVYFEFDSASLHQSSRNQLAQNASCIKEKGLDSLHLTGLTDPRGTEEYNLALGDRRAKSAKEYLQSLGVDAKLSHSSMGEELASGTDESSWAKDRRVDFR